MSLWREFSYKIPVVFLAAVCLIGISSTADALPMSYSATTGQTASADFSFINAITLQIILSETTPAATSSITGSDAILTSIGFLLPDAAVVASSGSFADGSVTINVGSQSEGFSGGSFGPVVTFPGSGVQLWEAKSRWTALATSIL